MVKNRNEGERMKESCAIIADLIPLVQDGVASSDSKEAVHAHIEICTNCRQLYEREQIVMPCDAPLIFKLQRHIFWRQLLVLLVGMLPALFLLEQGMLVFYNIILMPVLGLLSYCNLRRKWYYAPIGVGICCFLYELLIFIFAPASFSPRLSYSFALMLLTMLGSLIGFLLRYAFTKEEVYHHEEKK